MYNKYIILIIIIYIYIYMYMIFTEIFVRREFLKRAYWET